MMEASGKGNCMFASKNNLNKRTILILISALLCAPCLHAQQQQAAGTDEWEIDLRLPSAAPANESASAELVLPDEQQNKELQQLLSRLAESPGNTAVNGRLNALLADVLTQANTVMDAGSVNEAQHLLLIIQSIDPELKGLSAAKSRLKALEQNSELVRAGDIALESGRLLEPENDNAVYFYRQVLEIEPQNVAARKGLENTQQKLIQQALEYAREFDFETADITLQEAATIWADEEAIERASTEIADIRQQRVAQLEQKVLDAAMSGNFNMADFAIIDLMALGGQESMVKTLLERLEEARFYGGFEPGQLISDDLTSGGKAPDIIVIDAGSYLMGSSGRSDDASDHEEPQHRVIIKRGFGLGVTEVTVAQFQQFVTRTGYRTAAEISGTSSVYDESAGRLSRRDGVYWKHDYKGKRATPDMPVLHINAYDAQAYTQWLALETGKAYRLPSEAEYEYVARAGGNGTYWWGKGSPAKAVENLTGERDKSPNKRQWSTYFEKYGDGHWGPAPAGSLADDELIHPMGVHDIAGNVSEWMADCWHENYIKAPTDGSAWFNPGCDRRVVRGGYYASAPERSRAAYRFPVKAQSYGPVIGFRVGRDL
jgi:formylglycine-generating enzyme required for sulfatase activity